MDLEDTLGFQHAEGVPQRADRDSQERHEVVLRDECPCRQLPVEQVLEDPGVGDIAQPLGANSAFVGSGLGFPCHRYLVDLLDKSI